MTKKLKAFSLGGRLEWFIAILILLFGILLKDALHDRGIFEFRSGTCDPAAAEAVLSKTDGPEGSISHVQKNFHIVAPGVWRSDQLNPKSLKRLKAYGLQSIVNLRMDGEEEPWERTLAEKMGIQYYSFPVTAHRVIPNKIVDAVLSILEDPTRRPAIVHCAAGKDRTGMIFAAYRIVHTDWSFKDIYQEMMMYGYDDVRYPPMLESLEHWSAARGRPEMAREIALMRRKIIEEKGPASN